MLLIGTFMIMQTTVFANNSVNVNDSQIDVNIQSVDTIENLLKKESDIEKSELDNIKSNLNIEIKNEGKQYKSLDSEDENEIKSYDINELKKICDRFDND